MSQTFHPSEEGNLHPIKSRISEMVAKSDALSKSKIPSEFESKEVKEALKKLVQDSKKLEKLISSKGSNEAITKSLVALHDVFHKIDGLCSNEEHH